MIVDIIKSGSLAINPRAIISFKKGEVIAIGDKGCNESNLDRLVELGFARFGGELTEGPIEPEVDKEPVIEPHEDDYAFESFDNKDELEIYALDVYNVELDKRKSLKNMIKELKESIEKEIENDK